MGVCCNIRQYFKQRRCPSAKAEPRKQATGREATPGLYERRSEDLFNIPSLVTPTDVTVERYNGGLTPFPSSVVNRHKVRMRPSLGPYITNVALSESSRVSPIAVGLEIREPGRPYVNKDMLVGRTPPAESGHVIQATQARLPDFNLANGRGHSGEWACHQDSYSFPVGLEVFHSTPCLPFTPQQGMTSSMLGWKSASTDELSKYRSRGTSKLRSGKRLGMAFGGIYI